MGGEDGEWLLRCGCRMGKTLVCLTYRCPLKPLARIMHGPGGCFYTVSFANEHDKTVQSRFQTGFAAYWLTNP